ncbi:MAG: bifunctional aldolase/short-chain dehydrogenase [Candidatus Firestonebacteria bacterium]|nr:bifunctional aldolase/short-chain dehydrogenase [Candidatus Firestonebacteria bacterium]
MQNLWNPAEALVCGNDPVKLRVYTSRLLGQDPSLVLHGGGNTSVKTEAKNLFGETESLLHIKGSGWDLATLEPAGLVPVRLEALKKMLTLETLSDTDMVRLQRAAMLDPTGPAPSVEALLHALIPATYVDHTHADAVVTLTNTPSGEKLARDVFGPRVLLVPYVMPGFVLAKKIYELTQTQDWKLLDGIVLLNHGLFTFAETAQESYERMLSLIAKAEAYLQQKAQPVIPAQTAPEPKLLELAALRRAVSQVKGRPVLARLDANATAYYFSNLPQAAQISQRGPLTPDHVIRIKPAPLLLGENPAAAVAEFTENYQAYFKRHDRGNLQALNPAPCWAVWPGQGVVSFGVTVKETQIIGDILAHTLPAMLTAELLGGWRPVSEKDLFELEYWELEQAKLKTNARPAEFQGRIVLVTGAASGIGRACVEAFLAQGAAVAALDLDPAVHAQFNRPDVFTVAADVTDSKSLQTAVEETVRRFGGLDVLVSNAGIFPPSAAVAVQPADTWQKSLDVNLTAHQTLLQLCLPYLRWGKQPAVVIMGSKNVPAPGPGAAAYSVAKAGLTQLARVAALELAAEGIRVNVLHPNAVFDTKLWTPEVLEARARHYGLSVAAYKTNNLLRVEVTSADVARLAVTLAGQAFSKTTGAQVPIDGGNDRVI